MVDPTDVTLPITPAQIQRGVGTIVEEVHPRPRGEQCTPVGDMEHRLAAYAGELVQAAYNDATSPRPVIRNEDLTAPEQAAMDAWTRGSADTTGMLYAVRAALTAAGPTVEGRFSPATEKGKQRRVG